MGFCLQDFLGKSDPFLEFYKQSNAGTWQLVYRSEVVFPHDVFLELIRQLTLTKSGSPTPGHALHQFCRESCILQKGILLTMATANCLFAAW